MDPVGIGMCGRIAVSADRQTAWFDVCLGITGAFVNHTVWIRHGECEMLRLEISKGVISDLSDRCRNRSGRHCVCFKRGLTDMLQTGRQIDRLQRSAAAECVEADLRDSLRDENLLQFRAVRESVFPDLCDRHAFIFRIDHSARDAPRIHTGHDGVIARCFIQDADDRRCIQTGRQIDKRKDIMLRQTLGIGAGMAVDHRRHFIGEHPFFRIEAVREKCDGSQLAAVGKHRRFYDVDSGRDRHVPQTALRKRKFADLVQAVRQVERMQRGAARKGALFDALYAGRDLNRLQRKAVLKKGGRNLCQKGGKPHGSQLLRRKKRAEADLCHGIRQIDRLQF